MLEEELTKRIIGASFEVLNELGAGFLESVYEKSLIIALEEKGIKSIAQAPLKVEFRGNIVGEFYPDILVEDKVVIELKAIKNLAAEHEAQLLNYLKATGIRVGLLLNFGKPKLEWKRLVY